MRHRGLLQTVVLLLRVAQVEVDLWSEVADEEEDEFLVRRVVVVVVVVSSSQSQISSSFFLSPFTFLFCFFSFLPSFLPSLFLPFLSSQSK